MEIWVYTEREQTTIFKDWNVEVLDTETVLLVVFDYLEVLSNCLHFICILKLQANATLFVFDKHNRLSLPESAYMQTPTNLQ